MAADNTFVGVVVPAVKVESLTQEYETAQGQPPRGGGAKLAKEWVESLIAGALDTATGVAAQPEPAPALSLEAACTAIVEALQPEHRDLIKALSTETGQPLTAYIMSPIVAAKDHGRVGVLMTEYAQTAELPKSTVKSETASGAMCEECSQPVKAGTRYCPPPEDGVDGCGHKAARRIMQAQRDANRPRLSPSPFAPSRSVLVQAFTDAHAKAAV